MLEKQKSLGQFFTPKFVAEFMSNFISKSKTAKILEPSAGEGVFLDVLYQQGFHNISAYEIDPSLPNYSNVPINYVNFFKINLSSKFDLIIGNPPYVRWKNIPESVREELQTNLFLNSRINGLSDLLYAFIYYCVELLEDNGELIFITPLFWTETQHASSLRSYLLSQGRLEILMTFHEMRIFQDVSSNICIFKFVKTPPNLLHNRPIKVIHLKSKKKLTIQMLDNAKFYLNQLIEGKEINEGHLEAYFLTQFENGMPWKTILPSLQPKFEIMEENCIKNSPSISINIKKEILKVSLCNLIEKYEFDQFNLHISECEIVYHAGNKYYYKKMAPLPIRYTRLGDVAEIANGMVSGLDKAFFISDPDIYTNKERNKFIQVLKARNLTQYYAKGFHHYYLNNDEDNLLDFQTNFPNINTKLKPFQKLLENRYNYGNPNLKFWHWAFLRNRKLMEDNSEKLFVPCKDRVDKRNFIRFAYAKGPYYATQDVTVIVKKAEYEESLKYFLGILNSDLIFNWIKNNGLSRGGVLEFSERPLSIIPIRLINWDIKEEIQIHDEIVKCVSKIIDNDNQVENHILIEKMVMFLYGL